VKEIIYREHDEPFSWLGLVAGPVAPGFAEHFPAIVRVLRFVHRHGADRSGKETETWKMKYVDGFVIVLPEENLPAYREMAEQGAMMWKKHGALEYYECVGDDLTPPMAELTFPEMAKVGPGETVVFSFIVFESRAHRDEVNAKVMNDPSMNDPADKNRQMPFDIKKMAYGGFTVIVEG
jgi:uncharacterized protein YbaA (DUF1428 family)